MSSSPIPPERPQSLTVRLVILCRFTESVAEAQEELLLSAAEILPCGTTIAAATPALPAPGLPASSRRGGAHVRPGQQLRPLLHTDASLQWPPTHLAHWDKQVTFCSLL